MSTIKSGTSNVIGAPLPDLIAKHLPPSFGESANQLVSKTSFAQKSLSAVKNIGGGVKATIKSLIPGYGEISDIGGGSLRTGFGVLGAYGIHALRQGGSALVSGGRVAVTALAEIGAAEIIAGVTVLGLAAYGTIHQDETRRIIGDKEWQRLNLERHMGY